MLLRNQNLVTIERLHQAGIHGIHAREPGNFLLGDGCRLLEHEPSKNVTPVELSAELGQKKGVAILKAPGITEANRADYKAAFEAIVPMAIKEAQAQKGRKTAG